MSNRWSMFFIDGRNGTVTPYDGLEFKVENGKEFVKAPDGFLPVPTGWLMLPDNTVPKAIFFDRIMSCAVFFPNDKTNSFNKSIAMKFYSKEISRQLAEAKKNFDELKSTAIKASRQFEEADATELLKDKASELNDSGKYDIRLVSTIESKIAKIHEFLSKRANSEISYNQLIALIKMPEDMPADNFVLADCEAIVKAFIAVLTDSFYWYNRVDFSNCAIAAPELIRFYVNLSIEQPAAE